MRFDRTRHFLSSSENQRPSSELEKKIKFIEYYTSKFWGFQNQDGRISYICKNRKFDAEFKSGFKNLEIPKLKKLLVKK